MHEHVKPDQPIDSAQEAKPRRRWVGIVLKVLGVLACLALLVCLLLPAVRTARPAAYRNSCQNKLKQIAIALLNYEEQHGAFPPAFTTDADGKPLHSWRTLLLPYLEQSELYKSIDLSKPWDDPANAAAREAVIHEYACAGSPELGARTTYLAVVAPGSYLQPGKSRKLEDISDGTSRSLLMIEVDLAHAVHWMQPSDADQELLLELGPDSEMAHPGGFHAAFADGRVSFLDELLPADQRRALISIAGDDNATLDDLE